MFRKTFPFFFMCWCWFLIEPMDADPGRDLCKIYSGGLKCFNLTSYYFPENSFQTFNDDLARFTQEMKFLQIENSNISILQTRSFQRSPHISQLLLRKIHLTNIESGAFEGLRRIKLVDLSFNLIEEIPAEMFKYTSINSLKLEGNTKLKIPNKTPILQSSTLTFLSLKNCNIQHLYESTFNELPALLNLDLSQNHLAFLPDKIFSFLPQLSLLDLSSNQFTSLNISMFKAIPSFPKYPSEVILSNNPWICDCNISKLVEWVNSDRKVGVFHSIKKNKTRLRKLVKCKKPEGITWDDSEFNSLMSSC